MYFFWNLFTIYLESRRFWVYICTYLPLYPSSVTRSSFTFSLIIVFILHHHQTIEPHHSLFLPPCYFIIIPTTFTIIKNRSWLHCLLYYLFPFSFPISSTTSPFWTKFPSDLDSITWVPFFSQSLFLSPPSSRSLQTTIRAVLHQFGSSFVSSPIRSVSFVNWIPISFLFVISF